MNDICTLGVTEKKKKKKKDLTVSMADRVHFRVNLLKHEKELLLDNT